jgi:hypothetical protein
MNQRSCSVIEIVNPAKGLISFDPGSKLRLPMEGAMSRTPTA